MKYETSSNSRNSAKPKAPPRVATEVNFKEKNPQPRLRGGLLASDKGKFDANRAFVKKLIERNRRRSKVLLTGTGEPTVIQKYIAASIDAASTFRRQKQLKKHPFIDLPDTVVTVSETNTVSCKNLDDAGKLKTREQRKNKENADVLDLASKSGAEIMRAISSMEGSSEGCTRLLKFISK